MDGRSAPACAALLWALLTSAGCASTPQAPKPTQADSRAETEPVPEAAPPAEQEAPRKAEEITPGGEAKRPDTTVVIDPGGEKPPVSLVEAGRAERERRARSGPPVAVITDKNLSKHAAKGHITIADTAKKKAGETAQEGSGTAGDEQYWRSRGLEIRTRWREAADEVKELEERAAGWRRRFYAESDPYIRDSKVKPEWDRALDRLEEARTDIEAAKKELEAFYEEGRKAGALPGWLREGAELEPEPVEKETEPGAHDVIEPPVYDQQPPPI